ncbi:exonuclease domain-containing protein [Salinarimonas soli]|nr:exonuclease domain-containing protein [Salinarimonas soli]
MRGMIESVLGHAAPADEAGPVRAVVVDCETTGLSHAGGDRMVSFAAIEIVGHAPTGRALHLLFNPGRPSHWAARKVHGLSDDLLSHQPAFADHAEEIAAFVGDDALVGHNLRFDVAFLNAEFAHAGRGAWAGRRICTLERFKSRFPGQRASLDHACGMFGIDVSARARHHGAFIDAALACGLYQVLVAGMEAPRLPFLDVPPANYVAPPPSKRARRRAALGEPA